MIRSRQNDSSIGRGAPWCRTLTRIGEAGSHSPIATKSPVGVEHDGEIAGRSPRRADVPTEVIEPSNSHGSPGTQVADGVRRGADGDPALASGRQLAAESAEHVA